MEIYKKMNRRLNLYTAKEKGDYSMMMMMMFILEVCIIPF